MARPPLRTLRILVVLAAVLVGACSQSPLVLTMTATDSDDVVTAALDDLATFWARELPTVYGERFEPPTGGLIPYGPASGELFECGGEGVGYDDVAANALYCPDEDLIAWDRVELMPGLQDQFGPLTVGIVMAHEYGHAIQARGGVEGATVTLELQADCFAGAWVADVEDRIPVFSTAGTALDQAVGGFLELRDTVGVDARDPNAHGSGFDRVSAFQEGYDSGADQCAGYEDDPPPVVAIPFTSTRDLANEGNLPLADLIDPLVSDLDSYFRALLDSQGVEWTPVSDLVAVDARDDSVECGQETLDGDALLGAAFYCVDTNTIYLDSLELLPSLDEIGDFAVGGEIARLYAIAAQFQLGVIDDASDGGLHADCLNGGYAAAAFLGDVPDQQLVLSPGDLDEIITSFLVYGGLESTDSAFDRTAAFRTGFLGFYADCDPFIG